MNLILVFLLTGTLNFPGNFTSLDSFQLKFKQTTTSPMFPKIIDNGILTVSGCFFRFEYLSNEKRITLCNCKNIYQINQDDSNIMEIPIEDVASNPFISLLLDRQSINENFVFTRITEKPEVYRLVPKATDENSVFTLIKLTLDESSGLPSKIEVIDENQQVILYEFSEFIAEPDISDDLFSMEAYQ